MIMITLICKNRVNSSELRIDFNSKKAYEQFAKDNSSGFWDYFWSAGIVKNGITYLHKW